MPSPDSPNKEILSEDEMAALLGTGSGQEKNPSAATDSSASNSQAGSADKRRRVISYNFRRPDRVSKEQVRSLYLLHDTFAHHLSSSLAIFLRAITEVTLISIEQQTYLEYLYGLPDPTTLFKLDMSPLPGVMVFEMNSSITFPILDRQLGGTGNPLPESRPITDIEQKILDGLLRIVTEQLNRAWRPILDIDFQTVGFETHPQFLQIVAPNEVVLAIMFGLRVEDVSGSISLCIPAITLEPIIQKFNQSTYSRMHEIPPKQTRYLIDNMALATFPVAAELHGIRISVEDIMNMAIGDVIHLGRKVSEPIEVSVGGKIKYRGKIFASGDRTGLLIDESVRVNDPIVRTHAISNK